MNRREAIYLTGASFALVAGCANRPARAPTQERAGAVTLTPLTSTTFLPVANADYHVLDRRDIETNSELTDDPANKQLAGIYVDQTAVDAFHAEMTALRMTVHKKFDQALTARLQQEGLSMTRHSAADNAIAVRLNGDVATLGTAGSDAVIDVRVVSLGYRPMTSAMAMTPDARVALQVVRVSDSVRLAQSECTFDRRELAGNPRHFRCAAGDLFPSVPDLMANLPNAAAALDKGTMLMVNRVADDIVQTCRGIALT